MPLSGSTDFSMTAGDVVTKALKQCGIGLNGETPTAQETNDALESLNILMKVYAKKGLKIFLKGNQSITLVASKSNYTLGPSGDVTMDRPIEIESAYRRDSNSADTIMTIFSRDEYRNLSDKTSAGTPINLYFNKQLTNSEIDIWPVPTSSDASEYTLEISYRKPADDADATTDDIEFPPEWYRTLIWNLAEEEMESYDLPDKKQRRIKAKAKITLKEAESTDIGDNTSVYFQPNKRG